MAGIAAEIDVEGLEEVSRRLAGLSAFEAGEALVAVGELLANSAKERIATEKRAPDGAAWARWGEAYDATRNHGVHSLLSEEGGLLESLQAFAMNDEVRVGSNLIYAATHQLGREEDNIVARPFLGVSAEDELDILDLFVGGIEEAGA